jgi:hypothetical protein
VYGRKSIDHDREESQGSEGHHPIHPVLIETKGKEE